MVKGLFETPQAIIERLGVCLVFLSSVVCPGSSKLSTWFCVKLLAISILLYKISVVYTITSDRETNLESIEEFFLGIFF
jgi:hypothetical protein